MIYVGLTLFSAGLSVAFARPTMLACIVATACISAGLGLFAAGLML